MEEARVPSLFNLCIDAISTQLIHRDDDDLEESILEQLPSYLFDTLTMQLPPMSLHKLQRYIDSTHHHGFSKNGRKRGRYADIDAAAWKLLFNTRWPPHNSTRIHPTLNWHHMYWESHLQDCFDEAAEKALLPSFDMNIAQIIIPDNVMESIGHKNCISDSTCGCSKLSYHCQQYGCYARSLRLQSVFCVAETCDLLKDSKLQSLVLRRIKSKEHVNGACKLLSQNTATLSSVDFIYCNLPSSALNAICDSLLTTAIQTHSIQEFSIKASNILQTDEVSVPSGFLSFLSSGRSLRSLIFCENNLGAHFAKTIFDTLIDVSSDLSVLDLSENNISGGLSDFAWRFLNIAPFSLKIGNSLCSLRMLNLRDNNLQKDDAKCLRYCLLQMSSLEYLDISDNPIEDVGLRSLIPYFARVSERDISKFTLKIKNCAISCDGVTELLRTLSQMKGLNVLSIADNSFGSEVAVPLAKFLDQSSVRELNIEDIDLGSAGFLELTKELPEKVKLVNLNISKNRGGIETGRFTSKLILRAPELVGLNVGYNFMPSESLAAISYALKLSKGKLERLDLTGNTGCYHPSRSSLLAEFQVGGKPIVVLPSLPMLMTPYDDEP